MLGNNRYFVISLVMLLAIVPAITFSDTFAEKLIVASSADENAQFSVIDKNTGNEIQLLDLGADAFLSSLEFTPDGFLIASSSGNAEEGTPDIAQISFLIADGKPLSLVTEVPGNFFPHPCAGMATSPDGTLYCTQRDLSTKQIELHVIDLESGEIITIGSTGVGSSSNNSKGNGIAVNSDGIIYMANQDALFTLDPTTGIATQINTWNSLLSIPNNCTPKRMDFDSSGTLYASFGCADESFLGTIDTASAEITSFNPITRDPSLENPPPTLPENMWTGGIVFSPFNFDFLIGNSYGTVTQGFENISVQGDPSNGAFISTASTAEVTVCDNTSLSFGLDDLVDLKCNNTNFKVLSGSVESTFTTDEGAVITTTLDVDDAVIFDSEKFALSNIGLNDILVTLDGIDYVIPPGKTLLQSTIFEEISSKFVGKHKDGKWSTLGHFYIGDEKFKYIKGTGTFVLGDVPEPEPEPENSFQDQKSDLINELKEKTNSAESKQTKKEISKTIKLIEKSLDSKYWKDENTLNSKYGEKAINYEEKAVKALMKITNENDSFLEMIQAIIDDIVKIDRDLAQNAIDNAQPADDKKSKRDIDKALENLTKGDRAVGADKFDKGIDYYEKAWKYAQKATKNNHHEHDADKDDHHDYRDVDRCSPITAQGTYDFRYDNKLDIEFSGEVCNKRYLSSGDLDFVITGGQGDFEGATGSGDASLLIGKKHFGGKLEGQISIDSDPIVTECPDCIPVPDPPRITIVKQTNQDNSFNFTITNTIAGSSQAATIDTAQNDVAGPFDLVSGDVYSVTEDIPLPDYYTLENSYCRINLGDLIGTTFIPEENDIIECTFVNEFTAPPVAPILTIEKVTNEDNSFDFTVSETGSGNIVTQVSLDTEEDGTTSSPIILTTGVSYTVTEDGIPPNFTLDDTDCVITHGDGTTTDVVDNASFTTADSDVIVCTFVNTYTPPLPATLTIVKQTNQDNSFDFTVTNSTGGIVNQTTIDTLVSTTSSPIELESGISYDVAEINIPTGFTLEEDSCLVNSETVIDTVFLANSSDSIVCTFVNMIEIIVDPEPPELTIVKSSDEDGSFSFDVTNSTGDIVNQTTIDTSIISVAGPFDLIAGETYTVTEVGIPPNFTLDDTDCVITHGNGTETDVVDSATFVPALDDVIVCTFVNGFTDPLPPKLFIEKVTNEDNSFDFTVSETGSGNIVTQVSLDTEEDGYITIIPIELVADISYTVTEDGIPPNFTLDDTDCVITHLDGTTTDVVDSATFVPALDDVIVCTFVNTYTDPGTGTIQIGKSTSDGSSGTFDFVVTETDSGATVHSEQLIIEEGSNSGPKTPLTAGISYTLSELSAPGFILDSVSCSSNIGTPDFEIIDNVITFTLQKSEALRCDFTNSPTS